MIVGDTVTAPFRVKSYFTQFVYRVDITVVHETRYFLHDQMSTFSFHDMFDIPFAKRDLFDTIFGAFMSTKCMVFPMRHHLNGVNIDAQQRIRNVIRK